MALGQFTLRGSVSTNTDTAIAPAPGANQRIHLMYVTLMVSVGGTTSRAILQNGAGGAVLARFATVTADAILNLNYGSAFEELPGAQLSENTALNLNTTGAAAATLDYEVTYEVKGGT